MKNKILKKVKFEFKSLKAFDMIWLGVCVIGITIVALNTSNSLLAIISSIMGVIYVILNGCRLSVAFLFGMINTFVYAIVSYQNGLYGDFVMNLFYSFPCCIIGFILWFRASKENMITKVSSFKKNERIIFITIIILSILIFGMILSFFKDTQPYLDATTTVLSMSAYICLIKRKKEVWYLFNLSNILSILMWFINYISSNANISILFMYMIYTANSLINTVRWESSNRPVVEIDILFYKGVLDLEWMKKILDFQEDITINIYLYHQELKSKDQRIHIKKFLIE